MTSALGAGCHRFDSIFVRATNRLVGFSASLRFRTHAQLTAHIGETIQERSSLDSTSMTRASESDNRSTRLLVARSQTHTHQSSEPETSVLRSCERWNRWTLPVWASSFPISLPDSRSHIRMTGSLPQVINERSSRKATLKTHDLHEHERVFAFSRRAFPNMEVSIVTDRR